jgi:hypothetical protein
VPSAELLDCEELRYGAQPHDEQGLRFVRGASGLEYFGDNIAIVQDDVPLIALRAPSGDVSAFGPPEAATAVNLHTKATKWDLEAVTTFGERGRETLLAFGSGGTAARERIVVMTSDAAMTSGVRVSLAAAGEFYTWLRRQRGFASSELNVEGAAVARGQLVLAHRGTGVAGAPARSAALALPLEGFLAWLRGTSELPAPSWTREYDLGTEQGVPYGFAALSTSAAGDLLFAASAESTASPLEDGQVLGSKIGILTESAAIATPLTRGRRRAPIKVEGILPMRDGTERAWVIEDADDPERAAALCRVQLAGVWQTAEPRHAHR